MTVMAALATLASSVGLYPLFASGTWFWSGLGAVIVVAGAGLLMRRLRAPSLLGALGGLGALHLYLNARFASEQALLGLVPTPGSLRRLGELMGDGWNAANQYAAPVPLVPGIELLAATGIGLVAVAVDLLAVRLRRSAPAGLPLLAMYSVPAAVREDSVSWIAFGLGALGFLMLLMADAREQVGGWGRAVFTRRWSESTAEQPVERPDSSGMAASGRRIGVAAVAVAVLLPTFIPGIHPRGLFGMGGSGGGGSQTVTTVEPLAQLKRDLNGPNSDAVILTYRTDDTERPDYLRMYALDKFEGDRWTYTALPSSSRDRVSDRDLPTPPGLSTARFRRVNTQIKVRRAVKKVDFLPAPYAPNRVSIKGDWRAHPQSLMIYSLRDSASGRSYTVSSLRTQPTSAQLAQSGRYPSEIVTPYTKLPNSIPPQVRKLAEEVTQGAPTAYEQAVRLQRWFTETGGFTYDLNPPSPSSPNDLADFLLNSKRGYCEQFAASMAVMARILNIPARVAIGYTAGTQVGQGEWEVRSKDAHAWPELYFEGAGWVRFEPTPAGAGGQGTAATPPYTQQLAEQPTEEPTEAPDPESSSSVTQSPNPTTGPNSRPEDGGADVGAEDEQSSGLPIPVGWLAGGLLVILLLAAPMAARLLTRRRRWSAVAAAPLPSTTGPPSGAAAHAAWREVHADALDHGLSWRQSDSPRAAARRLGELLELDPPASQALSRIARAEEVARYARSRPPAADLRADVRTVRTAMSAAVGRRARLRARFLPPSTMSEFRDAGTRAMEAAGRLNAAFRWPRNK
ncbi:transglutaminase domain-containing protein [Actinomadura rudentiformis]|uniref:Transglutaminase domain-containing protein n=2 Tax=Actinomadura rudentiformis TaxID=359158 RepID=A0A6H9YCL9_9ACTN|nr:transglutaminase domain-containing protein [Actinomadura rudentiformis]